MTSDIAGLNAYLDTYYADGVARQALADLLDEAGSPLGPGYRALGRLQKYPLDDYTAEKWMWLSADSHIGVIALGYAPGYYLPGDWMEQVWIVAGTLPVGRCLGRDRACRWVDLASRLAADDAAAVAFNLLPPTRRAELLEVP